MPESMTVPVMTCSRAACTPACTIVSSKLTKDYSWRVVDGDEGWGYTNVVCGTTNCVFDVADSADWDSMYIVGTTDVGTTLQSPRWRPRRICGPIALNAAGGHSGTLIKPIFGKNNAWDPYIGSGTYSTWFTKDPTKPALISDWCTLSISSYVISADSGCTNPVLTPGVACCGSNRI